jgi:polyhydroxyalkanoate synthesis regulator phasin
MVCTVAFVSLVVINHFHPDPDGLAPRGKEVLQDLVLKNQDEYSQLTRKERMDLVQEFEAHKATRAKALRVSNKSRVNDVTHTIASIENEVWLVYI